MHAPFTLNFSLPLQNGQIVTLTIKAKYDMPSLTLIGEWVWVETTQNSVNFTMEEATVRTGMLSHA